MKNLLAQVLILIIVASCTQVKKNNVTLEKTNTDARAFSEKLFDINKVSFEFAYQLEKSKITFVENIINNPYEFRDYKADINISAANIGIYAADAQYLKAYGFKDQAYLSSQSARKLLNLLKIYKTDTVLHQIKPGYKTTDSAIFILNNALKDSINEFTEYERKQYLFSLILGSFIEKNYLILSALTTNVNYNKPDIQNILHLLNNHNAQLSNVFALRNKFIKGEYKSYLRDDLIKYNAYYLDNASILTQGHNQQATEAVIKNLLTRIIDMRNFIIYAEILIPDKKE